MALCAQPAHARRNGVVEFDNAARARMCCGLEGFPQRRWEPQGLIQIHMGAPPRWDLEGRDVDDDGRPIRWPHGTNWKRPHEDPEDGGCPGAWYRCEFVRGLAPYRRRQTGEGGRVENVALSRCEDRLIAAWIDLLESYEDAAAADYLRQQLGH